MLREKHQYFPEGAVEFMVVAILAVSKDKKGNVTPLGVRATDALNRYGRENLRGSERKRISWVRDMSINHTPILAFYHVP